MLARDDVFAGWSRLTDPSAMQPELPAPFRDARQLVLREGRFLSGEDRSELVGKLTTVPTPKVRRAARDALNADGSDEDRIRAIKDVVEAAGLQVRPTPKPLPAVSEAEVRLVCWMAVQGSAG